VNDYLATPQERPPLADVESPPESIDLPIPRSRFPAVLAAGLLFGGSLAWASAVFSAMDYQGLWTGASAGLGWAVTTATIFFLSVSFGNRVLLPRKRGWIARAVATLVIGVVVLLLFALFASFVSGNGAAAFLVLAICGALTVLVVRWRSPCPTRRDRVERLVLGVVYFTVVITSVCSLLPGVAKSLGQRGDRTHDARQTRGDDRTE
jgi:hypothetical protein